MSVQAQVLNLLKQLQKDLNLTYLFISHNLSVIAHMSDRVGVMYLGKMMEVANTQTIYSNPMHPYTHALMEAIPVPDPAIRHQREILHGDVPGVVNLPSGCVFHDRCKYATQKCKDEIPGLDVQAPGHEAACFYAKDLNLQPLALYQKS